MALEESISASDTVEDVADLKFVYQKNLNQWMDGLVIDCDSEYGEPQLVIHHSNFASC